MKDFTQTQASSENEEINGNSSVENQNTTEAPVEAPVEAPAEKNVAEAKISHYCIKCGKAIFEGQTFCSGCGAAANPVPHTQTVQPSQPQKKSKKGLIIGLVVGGIVLFTIIGLVIVLIVGGIIAANTIVDSDYDEVEEKGPDFQEIYDNLSSNYGVEVAADNSYLSIDTNIYDLDDYYNSSTLALVKEVHAELGLPDSLYQEMMNTSYSMGKQTETYESIGITVSWTYHPDKGMEVTYKLINN